MERWKKNGEKKLRVYLRIVFKTIFLFSITKNIRNIFDNQKLFSILKNKKYNVFKRHILVILCCFHLFSITILKNDYTNIENN